MLSALAFAVVVGSRSMAVQESLIPLAAATALLAKAGYPIKMAARISPSGTIRPKNAVIHVEFAPPYNQHSEGIEGPFDTAYFSIEVPLGRDVPLGESNLLEGGSSTEPHISAVPHLGRTAELKMSVPVNSSTTAVALRKAIERFGKEGATYAAENGGEFTNAPDTDWTRYRFVDALTIDPADKVSLKRLFASWGFKAMEPSEASNELRGDRVGVGGTVVSIEAGSHFAEKPQQTVQLSALVSPPQGEDPFTWAVSHGHAMDWLRELPSLKGAAEFRQTIVLSGGLPIGELRAKIVNFAATMRSLGASEGP
ncbi:hypothetical protein EON82_00385 [bacterium]|nr:MAG: hypothetical protein EON82_00385 [bacterium]